MPRSQGWIGDAIRRRRNLFNFQISRRNVGGKVLHKHQHGLRVSVSGLGVEPWKLSIVSRAVENPTLNNV